MAIPSKHVGVGITALNTLNTLERQTRRPGPDDVLVKVRYAAYGALDSHNLDDNFYVLEYPTLLGLGAAGEIVAVGANVQDLKVGDKVAAFTQPGGDRATQEYVTVPQNRVSKVPAGVKPDAVAAAIGNFVCGWWVTANSFGLPVPSSIPSQTTLDPSVASGPILVWGAGTGAGTYTLQILRLIGFTNIIATASPRAAEAALSSGATVVYDYNDPDVVSKILNAAGGKPIKYALNPVCTLSSLEQMAKIVKSPGSKVAVLIPIKLGNVSRLAEGGATLRTDFPKELNLFDEGVEIVETTTFAWESDASLRANLLPKILPPLLESGQIKPQNTVIVDTGSLLDRVKEAAALVRGGSLKGAQAVVDFSG